jgi:DNA primase
LSDLIARTKQEVDLQKLLAGRLENTREFGRYIRACCIAPDHRDSAPSMMVYPDGCVCTACGYKADAIDVYRLFNEHVSVRAACEALLAGDYALTDADTPHRRAEVRRLDQGLAVKYHFALVENTDALARLLAYGLTKAAIRQWRVGLATVGVEVADGVYEQQERFAIPVFVGGQLRQILYRASLPEQRGPKIQMETGAGSWLFGADTAVGADTVVIAEGWADAVCLWQAGIVAVTSTNGAGHWRGEFDDYVATARKLYVLGDADQAGQRMVARLTERFTWARPVSLPLVLGGKGDVRDLWNAGWRRPEFERLLKRADIRSAWKAAGGT